MEMPPHLAMESTEVFVTPKPLVGVLRTLATLGALYLLDQCYCAKDGCKNCGPKIEAMLAAANSLGKDDGQPIQIRSEEGRIAVLVNGPKRDTGSAIRDLLERLEGDGFTVRYEPASK